MGDNGEKELVSSGCLLFLLAHLRGLLAPSSQLTLSDDFIPLYLSFLLSAFVEGSWLHLPSVLRATTTCCFTYFICPEPYCPCGLLFFVKPV